MNRLQGRVALVTGAGQGIGRAVAETFAAEGASVLALDLERDRIEQAVREMTCQGAAIEAAVADVSIREEVRCAVARCVERFGGLDILVANAGIQTTASFLDVTDADWHRVLDVNLTGAFYCMQEAARVMAGKSAGAIVVIASTNAFWVEYHVAPYNASKAGVVGLVRSAAIDLAPHGIRVNAIEPGIVNTPLASFLVKHPVAGAEYLKKIPLGRYQEPDDVARTALYLASDDSAYVTGHALIADGGLTLGVPVASALFPEKNP